MTKEKDPWKSVVGEEGGLGDGRYGEIGRNVAFGRWGSNIKWLQPS